MSGGGGGETKSSSIAEPPAETKPYLSPYLERANSLSNNPYQEYSGKTVADLNSNQQQAFGMVQNRATQGSGVNRNANWNAQNTLGGAYLDPASNPWLSKTYDAAASDMSRNYSNAVMPGINSSFSLAGRYGSNAHQNAVGDANRTLASGLSNMGNQIYGNNYQQERTNQLNVMGMSPQLASADYADAQALMGAGDAQRAFSQEGLSDAYTRWQQQQQAPYTGLDVMGNAIMTSMGAGGKTTVYGPGTNQTGQLVGGALTAAGLLA